MPENVVSCCLFWHCTAKVDSVTLTLSLKVPGPGVLYNIFRELERRPIDSFFMNTVTVLSIYAEK